MNFFQGANGAALFLVLSATGIGIANVVKESNDSIVTLAMKSPSVFLLVLFLILFKIKTALDDHKHFGEPYQYHDVFRFAGFILAIFSWLFLALSGFLVGEPIRSTELLLISIAISCLWLVIHLMEIYYAKGRPSTEEIITLIRQKWLLINLLYILSIVVYHGAIEPVVETGNWKVLVVMLVIFIFDIMTSRSFRGWHEIK